MKTLKRIALLALAVSLLAQQRSNTGDSSISFQPVNSPRGMLSDSSVEITDASGKLVLRVTRDPKTGEIESKLLDSPAKVIVALLDIIAIEAFKGSEYHPNNLGEAFLYMQKQQEDMRKRFPVVPIQ